MTHSSSGMPPVQVGPYTIHGAAGHNHGRHSSSKRAFVSLHKRVVHEAKTRRKAVEWCIVQLREFIAKGSPSASKALAIVNEFETRLALGHNFGDPNECIDTDQQRPERD